MIKSEECRLLKDSNEARSIYAMIMAANEVVVQQSIIRDGNYKELMNCLKKVNVFIQNAAKCRGKKSFLLLIFQSLKRVVIRCTTKVENLHNKILLCGLCQHLSSDAQQ